MKKRNVKKINTDTFLYKDLRDCTSLKQILERKDLVDTLVTRLFAVSLNADLNHRQLAKH